MRSRNYFWALMVCLALFLATAAEGSIIVSRPGDPNGTPWGLGVVEGVPPFEQALAVSWSQTGLFYNVAINIYNLQNYGDAPMPVLFGLAEGDINNAPIYTAIYNVGAGATVPDAALDFGGPLTLPAGSWFLTAVGAGSGAWWSGDTLAQQQVLGTFGPEYFNLDGIGWIDGEGLGLGYQVTGDPAIPEPATWALMGGGLLLMAGLLRRRRS